MAPNRPYHHGNLRQALLDRDALAAEGVAPLGARLQEAVAAESRFHDQVRSLAGAYVDFATADANLLELLFARKQGVCDDTLGQSAADAFAPTLEMFRRGRARGLLPAGDPMRTGLVFLATLHGVAAMVNGGIVPPGQLHELIDDAVGQFLRASRSAV